LGIGWLKAELEDLAFRYINPASYREIKERLATGVEERRAYIQEVSDEVMRRLDEAKIPARVEGRLKHIHSIYNKMRNQNISFTDVHDLVALRIITDSVRNCYAILGIIHSTWTPVPGRFKDYIALPKANMYQSIHTTVMGPRGHRVEFQLRTEEMHLTAEEGIAAHWKYKEGGKDDEADARFSWLRRLLEWQHDLKDPREFLDTVRVDLYPEDVYVFTPKGEVKSFPRGATPVDFAYYIHTEVGNHCVGAKVNGRIVPLKYELKNGDVVEIITSPNRTPGRDWLNFVKTSRARTKIRAWIRAAQRERSVALGREILEKELVRYGADPADVLKGQRLEELARSLNYQEGRDLLAAIGFGKVSAVQLVHKLLPREVVEAHLRRHESRLRRIVERVARKTREGGVRVDGHHDMLIRFAKCCNPVPGERIVGFITRGRGVTVHAADCPNMRDLDYEEDRRVEVSWVYDQECRHRVMVALDTVDEPGVLAGVSSAIASLNANIASIHAATTDDKRAHIDLCIEIRDLQHLQQILKAIQQVRGVSRAFRVKDPSAAGRGQAG
ncbi:MAG: RelA/SpoT family protein, partial [Nitrospinota bacterium]